MTPTLLPSCSEASFVSHKPPASTSHSGPSFSGSQLPLSLCGCEGYWNHPLPTSPGCWTHLGPSGAWPGSVSSAQRPGQLQGPAFPREDVPCVPGVPADSTSLTRVVPISLYNVPNGKFAWKRHKRNKGKVRGSESNNPHRQQWKPEGKSRSTKELGQASQA